jgi:hypothetical protein
MFNLETEVWRIFLVTRTVHFSIWGPSFYPSRLESGGMNLVGPLSYESLSCDWNITVSLNFISGMFHVHHRRECKSFLPFLRRVFLLMQFEYFPISLDIRLDFLLSLFPVFFDVYQLDRQLTPLPLFLLSLLLLPIFTNRTLTKNSQKPI